MHLYQGGNCCTCKLKSKCTKAARRTIGRWEYEHLLEEMQQRVEADKEKIRLRQWLSEQIVFTKHIARIGKVLILVLLPDP